jgi:hypothetical protein
MRTRFFTSILTTVATFIAAAIVYAPNASAQTNVSGGINVDTIWTVAGSPYVMIGDVSVQTGATLTIEPGVTVQATGSDTELIVRGALLAVGTELLPTPRDSKPTKTSMMMASAMRATSTSTAMASLNQATRALVRLPEAPTPQQPPTPARTMPGPMTLRPQRKTAARAPERGVLPPRPPRCLPFAAFSPSSSSVALATSPPRQPPKTAP